MYNNFVYHLHLNDFCHENNLILLQGIFLLRSDSLLSKSVVFTKFASTVLASVANLLNSVVVI